jgi:cytoskeleton protein RodZ
MVAKPTQATPANHAVPPNQHDLRNSAGDTVTAQSTDRLTGDFVLTNPEPTPRQPQSAGELLREAREVAGLSQSDVANRLRMGVKQIDALERADYAAIPDGTFLRGFVRNYAKAVSVSPEDALAVLERTHTNAAALNASPVVAPAMAAAPISLQKRSDMLATPKARVLIVIGVVLLLAAAAWYWWANVRPYMADGGRPKPPEPVATSTATAEVIQPSVSPPSVALAPVDGVALPPDATATSTTPAISPAAPSATDAASPTPTVAPVAVAESTNLAALTSKPTEPDATKEASSDAAKAKRRPSDTGLIGFTFTGQSWVEITDGTGRTILSRRYNSGEADEVSGRGPFSIVIGNATVTRMAYNGREFDLSPHRRSNSTVARVNVK